LGGHREAVEAVGQIGQRRHLPGRHFELEADADPAVDRELLPVHFEREAHALDAVLLPHLRPLRSCHLRRRAGHPGSHHDQAHREGRVPEPMSAVPPLRPSHGGQR
jgi:hypothetical protein